MIHGRFQPFHNGHLEYLRGAAARSDEVFVGITNPDPARVLPEPSDPARHLPESNPWSYVERMLMVKAAALDLAQDDVDELLELARIAAHESGERINAPLLCYLVGVVYGRRGGELAALVDAAVGKTL